MSASTSPRRGYVLGLAAYGTWALFPLYFKTLEDTSAMEVVIHRVIWSAVIGALLLLVWRHDGWLRELYQHPKRLLALVASGSLIATNWLTYVWAVHNGHMVEASLGYYINPLVNVLLALLFLRERLSRLQWLALAMAAIGVLIQILQLAVLPWVALILALSFGFYGLIRKQTPVAALPGLVVETFLLLPLALLWLVFAPPFAQANQPGFWGSGQMFWLAFAGPITLLPLLAFNGAAKNLPYTTMAFLQYVAPTGILLLAVLYFDEPFSLGAMLSFAFIWLALAIYSFDLWRSSRARLD